MQGYKSLSRRLGGLAAIPIVFMMSTTVAAQSADESMEPMGELPAYSLTLSGFESGTTVTDNEVTVGVEPVGYDFNCALAGKANAEGIGHYHTILDGALIDMECTSTTTISLQNVAPGPHTLIVVPALDDHEEVQAGAAMVDFTYAPTDPLPEITAAETTGTPDHQHRLTGARHRGLG